METRVTEISDGVHQLTTVVPEAPVAFNQYLITGEEPMLFHTGMRGLFPAVSAAVSSVVPAESLRWIGFGHVEADECGSMNEWLGLARQADKAADPDTRRERTSLPHEVAPFSRPLCLPWGIVSTRRARKVRSSSSSSGRTAGALPEPDETER